MKKLTLLLLSVLCTAATTFAYDFQSGDLYYNIMGETTVEVTYHETYKGLTTATIPETVTYDGTTYSVTSIGDLAFWDCTSLPVVDNLRYADTYLVEAKDKSLTTYNIKAGTKMDWLRCVLRLHLSHRHHHTQLYYAHQRQ